MPAFMPAFLPIILASILASMFPSSQLAMAAERVPQFNIEPTCHGITAPGMKRDEDGCKRDESAAHDKLEQVWNNYTLAQRDHCARLSTLGGYPSYVELLTCLEMAKAAKNLPATPENNLETTGQARIENNGKAGRSINR